jgi:uncharacterized membrane protein
MAVLFAAIYLALMRLRQSHTTSAIHLSLAVVFLIIAIPLKASGRWITIGWLAEGAALLWVASRLSAPTEENASPLTEGILRKLAAAALTLGFLSLFLQTYFENPPVGMGLHLHETAFLNSRFATSLFGLASFAAAAWIALHTTRRHDESDDVSKGKSFPSWLEIAAASIIAFNLVTVLAVVREFDVLWYNSALYNPEAHLQKSLAISAYLMLYGAALLALGFWKRSAFLRWQALLLLVFTIAKTFLYDLRDLSQGYRVLSFLGLGALLTVISFVYQKDLLALRNHDPAAPSQEEANL